MKSNRRVAQLGTICLWMICLSGPSVPTACAETAQATSAEISSEQIAAQAQAIRTEQYEIGETLNRDFPNHFEALRILGFVHSSHGEQEQMVACLERCRQLQPQRADVLDQLGQQAFQAEKYQEALQYWQQARAAKPAQAGWNRQIGNAQLNLGQVDEALLAFAAELQQAPADLETSYLLGEAHFQKEHFAEAKTHFQSVLQRNPQHSKAVYGLIKTCRRLGEADEVAKYAAEFQRLEDAALAQDAQLRKQYDDLRRMRQNLAITCWEAGNLYAQNKRPRDAERLWTRATAVDGQLLAARVALVSLYRQEKRPRDAERIYRDLVRLDPQNLDHREQLAFLYASLRQWAAAEVQLQEMIRLAPEQGRGYRALAKYHLNRNQNLAHAQQLAQKAVELEPVADSHFVLGWALARNGRMADGQAAARQAVEKDPRNPVYRKLYDSLQRPVGR